MVTQSCTVLALSGLSAPGLYCAEGPDRDDSRDRRWLWANDDARDLAYTEAIRGCMADVHAMAA
jgi:hypothetical protein